MYWELHNIKFTSKKELSDHLKFFHADMALDCPICKNYSSNTYKNFINHLNRHNPVEIARFFTDKANLTVQITLPSIQSEISDVSFQVISQEVSNNNLCKHDPDDFFKSLIGNFITIILNIFKIKQTSSNHPLYLNIV